MVRVYDEVIERKGDVGRFCFYIENSRIGCGQSDGFRGDDVIERARVMVRVTVRVYNDVIERKGDVGGFCLYIENSRIGCAG